MKKLMTLGLLQIIISFSCTAASEYSVKEIRATAAEFGKVITFVVEKNAIPCVENGYLYVPNLPKKQNLPAVFLVHGGGTSTNTFDSLTALNFPQSLYSQENAPESLFVVLPSHTDPKIFERILVKTIWPYLIENYGMSKKPKHLAIGGASGGSVLAAYIATRYREKICLFYLTVGAFNVDDFRAWVEADNSDLRNFPVFYQMSGKNDPMFDKQIELGEYLRQKGVKTYNHSIDGAHDMKVAVAGLQELFLIFDAMLKSSPEETK